MKDRAKIALVTGPSRGLGKSAVLNLSKKGVDIIVTYHRNEEEAKSVVAAIEEMGAIASLLSEDNKWVNAQIIEVSGGQSI
jgi:NAD(P)-dependent dehydrogenase (short-subunit alcohol dehydrogenase family)